MKNVLKYSLISFICLLITACNSLKRIASNEQLLRKTEIKINEKANSDEVYENLLYQTSNTRIFGLPVQLYVYNIAEPNIKERLKERFYNNKKRFNKRKRLLSKKQLDQYLKTKIAVNNWFKDIGEEPTILKDSLTRKSLKRLNAYFWNHGWFNVKTDYTVDTLKTQKAKVTYNVKTGKPFIYDTISTTIESSVINKLYNASKNKSLIKKGEQYKTANLIKEKKRITEYMRNHGVYHFSQDYFKFDFDTINTNKKINVELKIANRSIKQEDTTLQKEFKIYTIKDVNIYTNSTYGNRNEVLTDTVLYNGYRILSKGKLHYRPKVLTDNIFIKPNAVFSDRDRPLTSRKISNLKTFKYPRIEYIENPDTTLTANIHLNPYKKFGLGFSTEVSQSNIQTLGLSLNPSILARNIFKGAETLELSGFASIGASKDVSLKKDHFFDIQELGANLKLSIPRFLFPVKTDKIIPKEMFPSTRINLSATSQTNIGLDKRTISGAFAYKWSPSKTTNNEFNLLNVKFVKNLNTSNYFNIYQNSFESLNNIAVQSGYIPENQELSIPDQAQQFINQTIANPSGLNQEQLKTFNSIKQRKERLTEDNLIVSSSFHYTKDRRENLFDNDFSIFKVRVESAGNLLKQLAKTFNFNEDNNRYQFLDVAFSQYIKTELEYIKYWDLGKKRVIAMRNYVGIAIPYGNSTSIPFAKSFFAGGANDNRAWEVYSLGPGSLKTSNEFNEANFKIAWSLEYRFNIVDDLNGALFVDTGNIFNTLDNVTEEAAILDSLSDLKDIAIGSGFGVRYDFNFFVLRGDVGFKTYNPALDQKKRWFNEYNFSNAVYNIGINYPF